MGPDANDLFLRLRYHHGSGAVIAAEADFERTDVNDPPNSAKRSWFAFDVDYPVTGDLRLGAVVGYEQTDGAVEPASSSPAARVRLEYSF